MKIQNFNEIKYINLQEDLLKGDVILETQKLEMVHAWE